jgi:hypothetical protein
MALTLIGAERMSSLPRISYESIPDLLIGLGVPATTAVARYQHVIESGNLFGPRWPGYQLEIVGVLTEAASWPPPWPWWQPHIGADTADDRDPRRTKVTVSAGPSVFIPGLPGFAGQSVYPVVRVCLTRVRHVATPLWAEIRTGVDQSRRISMHGLEDVGSLSEEQAGAAWSVIRRGIGFAERSLKRGGRPPKSYRYTEDYRRRKVEEAREWLAWRGHRVSGILTQTGHDIRTLNGWAVALEQAPLSRNKDRNRKR